MNTNSNLLGRKRNARHFNGGFSLIELLVVLVILGILAAVAVMEFSSEADEAKVKATKQSILTIENAITLFKLNTGRIPTEEEGVRVLYYEDAAGEDIKTDGTWKRLIKKPSGLKDAWKRDFIYRNPGQIAGADGSTSAFDIISYGADGQPGGTGKYDKDISNHEEEQSEGGKAAGGDE